MKIQLKHPYDKLAGELAESYRTKPHSINYPTDARATNQNF